MASRRPLLIILIVILGVVIIGIVVCHLMRPDGSKPGQVVNEARAH